MADDLLPKAVFAASIGVSPSRLSQFITSGAIGPEALVGKGRKARIRPAVAQAHLHARLDIGQRKVRLETPPPVVRDAEDAQEAVALIWRVLQEQGIADSGTIGFNEARTADTILKAAERDLKIAQRRKELVPLAVVKGHIEKAFIGYRQTVQRMPSRYAAEIAALLGCDPAALSAALDRMVAETLSEMSAPTVRS